MASVIVMFVSDKTFWVVPLKSTYFTGSRISDFTKEMLGKAKTVFNSEGDYVLTEEPYRELCRPWNQDRLAYILYLTKGSFNDAIAAFEACQLYIAEYLCLPEDARPYKVVEQYLRGERHINPSIYDYWRHGTIMGALVFLMHRYPKPLLCVPESPNDEAAESKEDSPSFEQIQSMEDYHEHIEYLNATSEESSQYW